MVMLERSTEFTDLLYRFFIDTPLEDNHVEYATTERAFTPERSRRLAAE
ncbi:hypothetical protein ACFYN3_42610 [Streptomyces lavendulae]